MKLKIYKRGNYKNWRGRIYIPQELSPTKKKQEIYISSGTDDFKKAERILNDWFLDIRYELKNGKFQGTLPILNIINKTLNHYTRRFELKEITKIQFNNFKNYIKPFERFIVKEKIKNFSRNTLSTHFLEFRKLENPNYRNTSYRQEINAIRLTMNYALDHELISESDLPKYPRIEREDNRRTFFRPNEYKKLLNMSKKRMNDPLISSDVRFQRARLHYWIIFVTGSGLRVSESLRLKFNDLQAFEDQKTKEKYLNILLSEGKTRAREVRTESSSYYAITKLKELYLKNNLSIQQNQNIFQTQTFAKSLRNLVTACDLYQDRRFNKKRDGKSFRQTYISWECLKNKRPLSWIAMNCGNSIAVIESNYINNLRQEDYDDWNENNKIVAITI